MYRDGRGVARNIDEAFRWYKKAADMLNPLAFCNMGYALEIPLGYLDPYDENADYKAAFGYFFKGAMLNEANSIYKIGDMYFSGKFVDTDQNFAFKMYEESYSNSKSLYSHSGVCLRLGECCYQGIGTEQDIGKARKYLEEAVEAFERRVKEGDLVKFISSGHKRAKFLLKEIDSGKIPARQDIQEEDGTYKELGVYSLKGEIIEQDYEKAFKCFAKCALHKINANYGALANLARMYREGLFVDVDEKFADYCESLSKQAEKNLENPGYRI